jgi:hypothetical protein
MNLESFQEIAENLTNSRLAHRAWRESGKPTHGEFIDAKKNAKQNLRSNWLCCCSFGFDIAINCDEDWMMIRSVTWKIVQCPPN